MSSGGISEEGGSLGMWIRFDSIVFFFFGCFWEGLVSFLNERNRKENRKEEKKMEEMKRRVCSFAFFFFSFRFLLGKENK